jgi:hypothetical protein
VNIGKISGGKIGWTPRDEKYDDNPILFFFEKKGSTRTACFSI